jgi:hypothetical protein
MSNSFDDYPLLKLVSSLNTSGENILDKIENTTYNDVLRLRMEAAERGIEMTPSEVVDLIQLLKAAGS